MKINEKSKVVKNINFLEHPMWSPSRLLSETKFYKDDSGFYIEAYKGLPNKFDADVLDFLLSKQQETSEPVVFFKSIYDIYTSMGMPNNSISHDALRFSLRKWKGVNFCFPKGTYYTKDSNIKGDLEFGVISSIDNKKTGDNVAIRFNPDFLKYNEYNNFKKTIPLQFLKSLTPISRRLYEVLCKSFWDDKPFYPIGDEKLLDKLGCKGVKKTTYHLKEDMIRAIKDINHKATFFKDTNILSFEENFNKESLKEKQFHFRVKETPIDREIK